MMQQKVIKICADDFALNAAIDDAICALVDTGRISGFSVMVTSPRWLSESAPKAKALSKPYEIGLHLNFTHDFAGYPYVFPLRTVIAKTYLNLLNHADVRASIEQQFDLFVQGYGALPDYLDGHQHVHQFPMIRNELLSIIKRRYADQPLPWIRMTQPNYPSAGLKANIIKWLGANALRRLLDANNIQYNRQFFGVYGFQDGGFETNMRHWLNANEGAGVMMCHPAIQALDDEIGSIREQEYRFLSSEQFVEILNASQTKVQIP